MKRVNNLYDKIYSIENLRLAEKKARKGKTKQKGVILFDLNKEENLNKLHLLLKNEEYKTSKYHKFTIFEGKEREIFKLPYWPDRIGHHAIMSIIEPIITKCFISTTYSCIKGRGIHKVIYKLKSDLKDIVNTKYCLKLDIKKYYPSIDHDILKQLLLKKFKDKKLLNLLNEIINSTDGVPIGNFCSQLFANFYLTYFDHWLKEIEKVKYYYRYCDDMIILHSNKKYLHRLLIKIKHYLNVNLKLEVKSNYQIFPVKDRGIDFIGYVFYHTHIKLRKQIKKNFIKMIKYNNNKKSIASYWGWCKHCNSINLWNKYVIFKKFNN